MMFFRYIGLALIVARGASSIAADSESKQIAPAAATNTSSSLVPKTDFVPMPLGFCSLLLSPTGTSAFGSVSSSTGLIGVLHDVSTGKSVYLKDYFGPTSWVAHVNMNKGYAIVTEKVHHLMKLFYFDLATLEKRPVSEELAHAFEVGVAATSSNGRFLLVADQQNAQISVINSDALETAPRTAVLKIPRSSNVSTYGAAVADNGQIAAVAIRKEGHEGKGVFSTQIHWLDEQNPKGSKIVVVQGQPKYLSPLGDFLITRVEKADYKVFNTIEPGKPREIELNGLRTISEMLWAFSGESAWENDVRIETTKTSDDGRWLVAEFQFPYNISGAEAPSGTTVAAKGLNHLLVRWDLHNPNFPPIKSPLVSSEHFDYAVSNEGKVILIEAGNTSEKILTLWNIDSPENKKQIPFNSVLGGKFFTNIFGIELLLQKRAIAVSTEEGVFLIEI